MWRFSTKYFIWAVSLLLVEAFLAAFVHDSFFRPVFGDFLVVILIYCTIKTFVNIKYGRLAFAVLLFAYAIEISQYYHLISSLGWQHSTTAQLTLGSGFSWGDIKAYTWGWLAIVLVEWSQTGKKVPAHLHH